MRFSSFRLLLATVLSAACHAASAAEVEVLLTKVDDGDAKHAQFEVGDHWRCDVHQDEAFALLRREIVPLTEASPNLPIAIAIDRGQAYQTMLGYGAAMTEASASVLMQLKTKNPELYAYTLGKLFSPTLGAGFSVLRLPMGASDYVSTKTYYTYCDQESPDLAGFSIAQDQASVIPALRDALLLNPELKLIATPWSPPAWMKTNRALIGVTAAAKAKGETCRLRPECTALYADYFVKFIQAYQAAGIAIYGVTLQNEPQFDAAAYPCMRMDEDDQIRLVRALGPKLAANHLATRIFVHDHNWVLHANDRQVIGGDAKLQPVDSVAKIMADPEAAKYIAGSAWHCYTGGAGDMKHAYDATHARFPQGQILTTELSGWGRDRGGWWGDVEWGMRNCWLGPEQNWSESALEWNLALDHRFGPTLRDNSAAMGIVTIRTDHFQDVKFEREFYAMAQMSRAARPGARRIAATISAGPGAGLDLIAFALPAGGTSLVVFNRTGGEAAFQVGEGAKAFGYHLPGHSIATFTW